MEVLIFYYLQFLLLSSSPLFSAVCPLVFPDLLRSFKILYSENLQFQLSKLLHLESPLPPVLYFYPFWGFILCLKAFCIKSSLT